MPIETNNNIINSNNHKCNVLNIQNNKSVGGKKDRERERRKNAVSENLINNNEYEKKTLIMNEKKKKEMEKTDFFMTFHVK